MTDAFPVTRKLLSFAIKIRLRAGLPIWAEAEFTQRLEDHLAACGLHLDDEAPHMIVRADRRNLRAVDQVDLLDWLFDDDAPAAVRIGPLSEAPTAPESEADGVIEADRTDLALTPLSGLYRAHRITAAQYLEILDAADSRWMTNEARC